jgi:PAS domain-containing protein
MVLEGAVKLLMSPMMLRMGLLLFAAFAAFGLGLFLIRRLRKNLVPEPESLNHAPLAEEGLPVHAYHAVIQQLKQQKHELTTQQLSERRKAKASDTLSSTILSNLSCGVLFLNTSGLVRQANAAARKLLGFASPVGLHAFDLFRTATLRPDNDGSGSESSVAQALAPALAGKAAVRGLVVNFFTRDGESHVLEVTASPVLAEDASLMGTTLLLTDKTDLERIRHNQRMRQEISSELALGLRNSLTTIAGYAQQLACSRDPELAHQLADGIAHEAAQLDRTIGSFLGGARAVTTSS